MEDVCDLCGKEFIKVDGTKGDGNKDSIMINDYIMMTEWYKSHKSDTFKISRPNPWVCRRCVKLLIDAGLSAFIAYGWHKFLTMQEEWWK